MAKRPKQQADDTSTQAPAAPRARRQHAISPGAPVPPAPVSEPSADDIRRRAYQRYLERGGGHGMDFDDWLEAERELKSSRT